MLCPTLIISVDSKKGLKISNDFSWADLLFFTGK